MTPRTDGALALLVASTALVFVPSMDPAFSKPKTWAFLACTGLAIVAAWTERARAIPIPKLPLALLVTWASSIAVSSLVNAAASPGLLSAAVVVVAISLQFPETPRTRQAVLVVGAVVAVVAWLQSFGLDPLGFAGLSRVTPGARMLVYGTLGNPDFVASFLTAALPFALVSGRFGIVAALVMLAALPACRSFATVLGLAAVLLVMFRRRPTWLVVGFAVISLLFVTLRDRDVSLPIEGRLALASVSVPHLLDHPLTGRGAGSFVRDWPTWTHPDLGAQDHAHLDAVEFALDLGWLGALAVLGLGIVAVSKSKGIPLDPGTAAAASVAASLVRGLVDFPLQRPADLALFAVAVGVAYNPRTTPEPP